MSIVFLSSPRLHYLEDLLKVLKGIFPSQLERMRRPGPSGPAHLSAFVSLKTCSSVMWLRCDKYSPVGIEIQCG